jgi:hypothetical protein
MIRHLVDTGGSIQADWVAHLFNAHRAIQPAGVSYPPFYAN